MVIWFIGLSGAGKSTFSSFLYQKVKTSHPNTVIIDGDCFRGLMGGDLGYSEEDREKNGYRICKFGKFLDEQKINVIVAVLSNFPGHQLWNRNNYSAYKQVYIKVSQENLKIFGKKSVYGKKEQKNIVGIDIPFYEPFNSDFIIDNTYNIEDMEKKINEIYSAIEKDLI